MPAETIDTSVHGSDWSTVAAGWDAHRAHVESMKASLRRRMLDDLRLAAGDRVLELGAGTGEFARALAAAVGPTGHVVATDVADGMVELIRATTRDLPNVTADRRDAGAIDDPDASYDAVSICMGLMFLARPDEGLAEIHRVLRTGGRLSVATWAAPEHNPWLTTVGLAGAVHGVLSGGPPVGPGGVFSLGDPEQLAALASAAGFSDVAVDTLVVSFDVPDVEAYLDHVTSLAPPLAEAFRTATPEQRDAVLATVADATRQFRTDENGIVIPGRALVLRAVR